MLQNLQFLWSKNYLIRVLLSTNVVRNSVACDQQVLVNENANVLQNKLKRLFTHLMKLKILTSVQCDKITEQFTDFTDSQLRY